MLEGRGDNGQICVSYSIRRERCVGVFFLGLSAVACAWAGRSVGGSLGT